MTSHFSKPKSLQEQLAEEKRQRAVRGTGADGDPSEAAGWLCLGKKIKGDLMPAQLGLQYQGGWLYMAEDLLDQHLFLLGATGAGKSETIKRLVEEILAHTDRDIYFVDGKGDEQLANDIRSLAYHYNRGICRYLSWGLMKRAPFMTAFGARVAISTIACSPW